MSRIVTHAEINKRCLEKGFKLLEPYKRSRDLHKFLCQKHKEEYLSRPNNILRGRGLSCCKREWPRENKKFSIQEVKNKSLKMGFKFLDKEYINTCTKIKFKCLKHKEVYEATLNNILAGKGLYCCKRESTRSNKIMSINKAKTIAKNLGFILLNNRWYGCYGYYRIKCLKHFKIHRVQWSHFQQNHSIYCCWKQRIKEHQWKQPCGENHPNWNHNLTNEDRINRGRRYCGYARWAKKIKSMNDKCCICGNNKNLHAHHLESYSSNPDLRLNLNNGATLCREHHVMFHSIFGIKNNTKKQFDAFVNEAQYGPK